MTEAPGPNGSVLWTTATASTQVPTAASVSGVSVFLGVLLGILSVVTLLGNIGTIWAFRSNVLLRQKPSNLLILSLSCSDLIVGATGLPVASLHTGLGYWPLGKPVCIVAAFFSVVGVSAAMYTVTAISLDRWLLVSSDYSAYLRIQSARNVKLQIAAAWAVGILISSTESVLWIVGLGSDDGAETIHYSYECRSPVRRSELFILVIFVILFAIPFGVMVVSTGRFAFLLRRRLRRRCGRGPGPAASMKPAGGPDGAGCPADPSSTASEASAHQNRVYTVEVPATPTSPSPNSGSVVTSSGNRRAPSLGQTGRNKSFFGLGISASRGASRMNRAQKMKNRYVKPAVRLAILLGVFALCTLPYPVFLIAASQSINQLVEVRNHLSNLLLSNSGMNPFLYAIMHRRIRLFYAGKVSSLCCRGRSSGST